jgi:hypothetical protein
MMVVVKIMTTIMIIMGRVVVQVLFLVVPVAAAKHDATATTAARTTGANMGREWDKHARLGRTHAVHLLARATRAHQLLHILHQHVPRLEVRVRELALHVQKKSSVRSICRTICCTSTVGMPVLRLVVSHDCRWRRRERRFSPSGSNVMQTCRKVRIDAPHARWDRRWEQPCQRARR